MRTLVEADVRRCHRALAVAAGSSLNWLGVLIIATNSPPLIKHQKVGSTGHHFPSVFGAQVPFECDQVVVAMRAMRRRKHQPLDLISIMCARRFGFYGTWSVAY
jgi:hypothetical protein